VEEIHATRAALVAGRILIGLGKKRCEILQWRISWLRYVEVDLSSSRI
jgi:hypothetical protein